MELKIPVTLSTNIHVADGMLVINKPRGMVSRDVSRWLEQRLPKKPKMGHVGTLDPLAEGVLPMLFGKATRLQDFLVNMEKSYQFDLQFGFSTDTLDSDGRVVNQGPIDHLTVEKINAVLPSLIGEIRQIPPLYSAVKYRGKPLYRYARADQGDQVPREMLAKNVMIKNFFMLHFENNIARFAVVCSKGTYVRVLAEDLCKGLGTCGTVVKLVRTSGSGVNLQKAVSLEQLERDLQNINMYMIPLGDLRLSIPRWRASSENNVNKLKAGQKIRLGLDEFGKEFPEGVCPDGLKRGQCQLVLTERAGCSFGLGMVSFIGNSEVIISMRRGLW